MPEKEVDSYVKWVIVRSFNYPNSASFNALLYLESDLSYHPRAVKVNTEAKFYRPEYLPIAVNPLHISLSPIRCAIEFQCEECLSPPRAFWREVAAVASTVSVAPRQQTIQCKALGVMKTRGLRDHVTFHGPGYLKRELLCCFV